MRQSIAMAVGLAAAFIFSSCLAEAPRESERDNLCVSGIGDVCAVPFSVVVQQRSLLVGREVFTKGYVRKDGDVFLLYSSSEQARYGIREGAILLMTEDPLKLAGLEYLSGRYASVGGVLQSVDRYWTGIRINYAPRELPEVIYDLPEH